MLKVSSVASHELFSSRSVVDDDDDFSSEALMAMESAILESSEGSQFNMTSPDGTHPRDNFTSTAEPPSKRIKTELIDNALASGVDDTVASEQQDVDTAVVSPQANIGAAPQKAEHSESSLVTTSSGASHSTSSNTSLQHHHDTQATIPAKSPVPNLAAPALPAAVAAAPPTQPPLKATTMDHLRQKYLGELEYMLREFRKLERQLLGAKGAAQLEESAGSRERREKLHSFILHLEDTVRQIEVGCAHEDEEKAAAAAGLEVHSDNISKSIPTKEGEEEQMDVPKLEEHILANLLPVKSRLKKQLAAQQGATRNPPGMPAVRRGSLQPSQAALGKGTFAAAAEERRKQAEAARLAQEEKATRRVSDPTQFGKPLRGGGSSLTQKLHGATLGSSQRTYGHGVGSTGAPAAASESKVLYAGMVPQSKQHQSSLNAASGVHELVVEDPKFLEKSDAGEADNALVPKPRTAQSKPIAAGPQTTVSPNMVMSKSKDSPSAVPALMNETFEKRRKPHEDATLSEDERRKLRKKRRKRKLRRIARRREKERQRQLALHQQAQAAQGSAKSAAGRKKSASSKPQGKKKGPKPVEYMCALCSEAYSSTCDYNPWWALAQHECPKCRKSQIPRIDISAPANAIEYHPALLAHADDNNGGGGGASAATTNVHVVHVAQPPPAYKAPPMEQTALEGMDSDSESDLSELSDGSLSDDSDDSDDSSMDFQLLSQAEQAEHESFGDDYEGPVLSVNDASRLLVLMAHASTCPCKHKVTKHRDVCKSTKFMMLHVRDCPGTTASFDVCPFPWCRKVKHLMFHLVSCVDPESCGICSPKDLSDSLKGLTGLNEHRLKKHRHRLIAATRAANSARPRGAPAPSTRPVAQRPPSRKASDIAKAAGLKAKHSTGPKHETKTTKPAPTVVQPMQKPAASPAMAVLAPVVKPPPKMVVIAKQREIQSQPPPKMVVIAKQPEIQSHHAKISAKTTTIVQSDLMSSGATVERAEIGTTIKTEPEEVALPAANLESQISTNNSIQQDPPPTAMTPPAPQKTAVDHVEEGLKKESTTEVVVEAPAAPTGAPQDTEMSAVPDSQPEVLTATPVAPCVNQTAVKMETDEEAVPGASPKIASVATDTAIETTVLPPQELNATVELAPTIKADTGENKAPTAVSNSVQVAPFPALPVTVPEAESLVIKEEPGPPNESGKVSSSTEACSGPPGEAKQYVEYNETLQAIAPDGEPAESPMETENTSDKAAAIARPIQTQASSEALKIACQ